VATVGKIIYLGYKNESMATGGIWKAHRLEGQESLFAKDIYIFAGQYIHKLKYNENTTFNIGGGFHHYAGVQGNVPTYAKGFLGNSSTNGLYDHDYSIAEFTGEVKLKEVWGKSLKLSTVLAYNVAVSEDNFGVDFSMQWGSAKKNNLDWQLGYTYRYVEKDAVYGAHNDSDFIGGGTDGKGHIFTGKVKFNPNLYGAFHYQISETRMSTEEAQDYNRLMVDLILKF